MTAGKARAGCPIRNIQSTLDGLTRSVTLNDEAGSGPGLTVAVYEEATTSSRQKRVRTPR